MCARARAGARMAMYIYIYMCIRQCHRCQDCTTYPTKPTMFTEMVLAAALRGLFCAVTALSCAGHQARRNDHHAQVAREPETRPRPVRARVVTCATRPTPSSHTKQQVPRVRGDKVCVRGDDFVPVGCECEHGCSEVYMRCRCSFGYSTTSPTQLSLQLAGRGGRQSPYLPIQPCLLNC